MKSFNLKSVLYYQLVIAGVLGGATYGASAYDAAVLADGPALYLRLSAPQGQTHELDRSGHGNLATYHPSTGLPKKTRLPNGESATVFNGFTQYLEVRSSQSLSVKSGSALTLEAWIRPDTLQFPSQESDGYVHWAGKGESSEQEYALRMYSHSNSASRPNRISGYVFNPSGGLGSGSYFQDPVVPGVWIHVALVIDARTLPGSVSIYKNGVLRKTTSLSQFGVVPQPGGAPLRIATRDMHSFFQGAIGKFAVYHYALSGNQLLLHFNKM